MFVNYKFGHWKHHFLTAFVLFVRDNDWSIRFHSCSFFSQLSYCMCLVVPWIWRYLSFTENKRHSGSSDHRNPAQIFCNAAKWTCAACCAEGVILQSFRRRTAHFSAHQVFIDGCWCKKQQCFKFGGCMDAGMGFAFNVKGRWLSATRRFLAQVKGTLSDDCWCQMHDPGCYWVSALATRFMCDIDQPFEIWLVFLGCWQSLFLRFVRCQYSVSRMARYRVPVPRRTFVNTRCRYRFSGCL